MELKKILGGLGISYCLYQLYKMRYKILLHLNYYYLKMIENKSIGDFSIFKKENIDDIEYSHYTFDNKEFIAFDEINIDHDKYSSFKNSIIIPNSPDNILMATLYNNHDEIDVTDTIQKLCGPFVDKIKKENKEKIFLYLKKNYNSDITKLELFMSDGSSIILD